MALLSALRRWRLARRRGVRVGAGVVVDRGVRVDVAPGAEIVLGDRCRIGPGTRLVAAGGGRIEIGERASLGERCRLVAHAGVTVGADALLADEVVVVDVEQPGDEVEVPLRVQPLAASPVVVGEGARLSVGATLLPGARVAPGATVPPQALVTSADR